MLPFILLVHISAGSSDALKRGESRNAFRVICADVRQIRNKQSLTNLLQCQRRPVFSIAVLCAQRDSLIKKIWYYPADLFGLQGADHGIFVRSQTMQIHS